ncbi:MAG: hypothetical protein M1817_005462 [Caeruleum heppii]|nr:MAG: hypothetical protein M1817_005462 [Caeruleum heppii]
MSTNPTSPTSSSPSTPPPRLITTRTTTPQNLLLAHRLITDSIAQQRQLTSQALIYHPLILALYVLLLGGITQALYRSRSDVPVLITTLAGVTMICLVAVRQVGSPYIFRAESVGRERRWLNAGEEGRDRQREEEDDVVIVTMYGDTVVGVVVVRLPSLSTGEARPTAYIRAWTVLLRYRRCGVGEALLVAAVEEVKRRVGQRATVDFDREHANSLHVLPSLFDGPFERREMLGRRMLEKVVRKVAERKEGGELR